MNIRLCMISCQPALFYEAVGLALNNAEGPVDVVGIGNGCELEWRNSPYVKSFPENHGVVWALHELWKLACTIPTATKPEEEVLVYIHDDFHILEKGWDLRVKKVFEDNPKCGLAGFGGSTALGGDEIYKKPYEVHQLGRRNFYSNMVGAEVHGKRVTQEMPIVFTDGQSMIVRRDLLDEIDGWSWWPFENIHHAYDYGIACQTRRHGRTAWLVPIHCNHVNFQTASQPVYKNLADKYGGDAAVHDKSHRFVYETFRDVLPLRL